MRFWFEGQPDLFLVAVHEDQIVGGAVAGIIPWWDGCHLSNAELFVHPDFQKRRIAKRLLKELLTKAVSKLWCRWVWGYCKWASWFSNEVVRKVRGKENKVGSYCWRSQRDFGKTKISPNIVSLTKPCPETLLNQFEPSLGIYIYLK